MKRHLSLRREALAELATDELSLVHGAALPSGVCTSAVTFCDLVCEAVDRVRTLTPGLIEPPTDRCLTNTCTT